MQSTLVLNATYEPLSVVSAHRALALMLAGKAVSVDDSDVVVRSTSLEMNVPHVIRLNDMVKRNSGKRTRAPFSRRGVLARDKFTCAYCKGKATTIDHVVPRMLGGQSTYENCVAACGPCNRRKGHKTLEALGWKLPRAPKQPSWYLIMLGRCTEGSAAHSAWKEHIAMWDDTVAS